MCFYEKNSSLHSCKFSCCVCVFFSVFAQDETDGDDFITPPPVEDDAEKKEDEEPEEDDDWLIIPQYEDGLEGDGN